MLKGFLRCFLVEVRIPFVVKGIVFINDSVWKRFVNDNIAIFENGEVFYDQLPPTEVGGLFLSSVVERLKADSLPKDSVL